MNYSCFCENETLHGDPPRPVVDRDGFRHTRDACETLASDLVDAVKGYARLKRELAAARERIKELLGMEE